MKKLTLLALLATVIFACKQEVKTDQEPVIEESKKEEIVKDRSADFPEDIAAIFKAHGGIQAFDAMNTLVFELEKTDGNEKHTTDLKTRHARIETNVFVLGFDGEEAWLEQEDSTAFKGNPRFYHNLMFYFYAMPFVLGDEGISYEKVDDLKIGDISYPGYKISYNDGVGDSPEDNYFLYYDATTKKMKFLGYTVTFFSKEASDKISLIEYSDWNDVNGLLLPKTIKWRAYENGEVGDVKSERNFVNAEANTEKVSPSIFKKTSTQESSTL